MKQTKTLGPFENRATLFLLLKGKDRVIIAAYFPLGDKQKDDINF